MTNENELKNKYINVKMTQNKEKHEYIRNNISADNLKILKAATETVAADSYTQ